MKRESKKVVGKGGVKKVADRLACFQLCGG